MTKFRARMLGLAACLALFLPISALAQQSVWPGYGVNNGGVFAGWQSVDATHPLPVGGTIAITGSATGAAVPAGAFYNGLNVAGILRGWTGLGLGSVFAGTVAIVDASGNQITTFGGGGGATGAAVPATAGYGGINVAGTLRGQTGVNPSGSIFATQVDIASIAGTTATPLCTTSAGVSCTVNVGGIQGTTGGIPVSTQTSDPCGYAAKSSTAINITSATTTSLVAVSGSTTVYVCGFSLTVSEVITTANTILFERGTGAACTSPTALTGTFGSGGVLAASPITVTYGSGVATIFKGTAADGICALTAIGGSGTFQGVLTYVQQ